MRPKPGTRYDAARQARSGRCDDSAGRRRSL